MMKLNSRTRRPAVRVRLNGAGFSLIELMIALAILGVLAALAVSSYREYLVRARVTEGIRFLDAWRSDIVSAQATLGRLPRTFREMGWSVATGTAYGGDQASYEALFGAPHAIWTSLEWQPKPSGDAPVGYVLVLRSRQDPAWGNVDLGLHFQVKVDGGAVRFRCTVNENAVRMKYVPTTCRTGTVDGAAAWAW